MKANQERFPLRLMCRVLGVSSSGYYAWRSRGPSPKEIANERLRERMREIHRLHRETYGRARIQAELCDEGYEVNHKRVARLMKPEGLEGVSHRRKWHLTKRAKDVHPSADLVERDFGVTAPDRIWVADVTSVPTSSGLIYLAVVVDAWSRRVVGWSMETHMHTELVLGALNLAIWQRRPLEPKPVHVVCLRTTL